MTGAITLPNAIWSIKSADNVNRINYDLNGATYFHSGNTTGTSFAFKNNADTTEILTISNIGDLTTTGLINAGTNLQENGTNLSSKYLQLAGGTMTAGANITTTGLIRGGVLGVANGAYEFNISPPTASTASTLQTIQQGVGYNQNLAIQAIGGNVGIGTATNINDKLVVNGNITTQILNLTTLASGNSVLFIKSTNTSAYNNILFENNLNKKVYIGIGGSALTGNYANNFYIESANGGIILNTQGRTSTSTPNLLINTDGNIVASGNITCGETLKLSNTIKKDKLLLWDNGNGTYYGFGIATNTLQYTSDDIHKFYTDDTNTFTIDGSGNVSCTGTFTNGSSNYMYAGGLRISGADYGNTFFQDLATI